MISKSEAPAKRTRIVWQTFGILLVRHKVCQFGHDTNMYLANISACDKQICREAKSACQAMFVVVAKGTSILDRQNSKCLLSNVCTFGRSLTENF